MKRLFAILLVSSFTTTSVVSESECAADDGRARSAIFDDSYISEDALAVHRRAARMSVEKRHEFLSDWVLPGPEHDTIRTAVDFTPTHPAPPARGEDRIAVDRLRIAERLGQSRVQIGGLLVSPALDLVEAARELGRLKDVRRRVDCFEPASDEQRRSRLAMLVAVDAAYGNHDEALAGLDQLFSLTPTANHSVRSDWWPEMLAIRVALQHAETRQGVHNLVYQLVDRYVRSTTPSESKAWPFQLVALMGQSAYFDGHTENASSERFGLAPDLTQWAPANHLTALSRGTGRPPTHWQVAPGSSSVENFAGHGNDYLYFQSPLRGNYAVECDVTPHSWQDIHLSVAGTWITPAYKPDTCWIGGARGGSLTGNISPPLRRPNAGHRLRTVVRDGVCTTFYNGRRIHEESLSKDSEPWLAIHSFARNSGVMRNLRITGSPVIPEQLRLTATDDLSGWRPSFAKSPGSPTSNWRQSGDLPNAGGIVGVHTSENAGSMTESVFYYHRPMLEDGEIEYDFYYEAGVSETHPALGRLAFMLAPNGVRTHWITDGAYERSELDPGHLFDEPQNRRGSGPLPLEGDAWNRIRLTLIGDTVQLALNGKLVYERQLELTNQRTFGLFHYSDRTEASVRNVMWRGDWPRELPSLDEQELAGDEADFLQRGLPELTAVFEHDFARDGLPEEHFSMIGRGWKDNISAGPDGIHVARPGAAGYVHYSISPRLKVQGDFDITASFEGLETLAAARGTSGVMLTGVLDREKTHQFHLHRRLLRHRGDQSILQSGYRFLKQDGTHRDWLATQPDESMSGTMRFARRGEQVYFLFAQGDSTVFRLVGEQTISDEDLRLDDGVQFGATTSGLGLTNVVWKNIRVRASQLTGAATVDHQLALAELDRQRDALPHRFQHDFAQNLLTEDRISRWGAVTSQKSSRDGLHVIAPGSDNWTSVGLAPQLGLQGDFDAAVTLDVLEFGKASEKQSSVLYWEIVFPDTAQTQAALIFVERAGGGREIFSRIKTLDAKGKTHYRNVASRQVDGVESLRMIRRGKRISFVMREKGSDHDRDVGEADITDLPIQKGNVRLMLHTGGAGRQSELLLKQFRIHATKIDPIPPDELAMVKELAQQLTGELPSSALEFDGRTQYVTIPSIRYDGSHPITLEAFVTPDRLRVIVIGDTEQSGVDLGIPGQNYTMHAWNGTRYASARSDTAATPFLRIHLAGTFDGESLQLFVNGKHLNTTPFNGTFKGSGLPMTIGASPSPRESGINYAFAGVIDQVRISRTVRYTRDFAVPVTFDADDSTLAVYRFDEGQGETLKDSSGNKHHGEIRGATWVSESAIRHRAALELAEFGRHAVGALTEAFKHQNPDVRVEAAAALETIGEEAQAALPALMHLDKDDDPRVRAAAARARAGIEGKTLLKTIRNLFD